MKKQNLIPFLIMLIITGIVVMPGCGDDSESESGSRDLPVVATAEVRDNLKFTLYFTGTSARGGGEVLSEGDASVTDRGLCWKTTHFPTINDSKVSDGSGAGVFENCDLTGLTEYTDYYVRAYATSSLGTSYGHEIKINSGLTFTVFSDGGWVFYNDGYGGGLVAAGSDQSAAQQWSNVNNESILNTLAFIGQGHKNTAWIITQAGHIDSAAKVCDDYIYSNFIDWFLPSIDELNLMHLNVKNHGNFHSGNYWSSSESNPDRASCIDFSTGTQATADKSDTLYVRAVRRFERSLP